MTTTPRIPPVPKAELSPEALAALGPLAERDELDNVFGTFAQHPDLFRRYSPLGNHVLFKSTIEPRERELAILRIGSLNRAEYEFAQHTIMGVDRGLTAEEVARVHDGPLAEGWNERDRAILLAADELFADSKVSDETWSDLAEFYDTQQLMDLVFAIGVYNLISWSLNSFGVQLDDKLTAHPWPFVD